MNTKTLARETVVIELEPWEARRLHTALVRIKQRKGRTPPKSEFSLSEKVIMRKLIEQLEVN